MVKLSAVLKIQRDIILGTILGDGSLEFNGYVGTRLQIKQKESHKQYVMWLYEKLSDLCKTPPKQKKDTNQWYFSTRALKELTELREIFYKSKKKIIPLNIRKLIKSPLSIAVWYMDDGNLDYRPKSHYSYRISTDSFSLKEKGLLVDMLKENFNIKTSVANPLCRGKRYPKLYIGAQGRETFLKTINSYVLRPVFLRKIRPINTT